MAAKRLFGGYSDFSDSIQEAHSIHESEKESPVRFGNHTKHTTLETLLGRSGRFLPCLHHSLSMVFLTCILLSGCLPGGSEEHQVAERIADAVNRKICGDGYLVSGICDQQKAYFDTSWSKAAILVYGVRDEKEIDAVFEAASRELHSLNSDIHVEVVFFDSMESKKTILKRKVEK